MMAQFSPLTLVVSLSQLCAARGSAATMLEAAALAAAALAAAALAAAAQAVVVAEKTAASTAMTSWLRFAHMR